ncbi:TfuA-related McrA-glycine thioamidation protein [Methanosphaera sp. WGK6]|uniref:TfuA-related McrA-glycine thioamidation protein n=1 Tax=Methanosphaera sp. WGK6 TaxID=1561964 RepID=UPI00084C2156|nr:TfuA-related McrA-glycine thioamidation protein [Methanosphaera sp. WGK6]OED30659.1 TfuA domain protein core [Methanosphaera sp. WGK6]
MTIVIYTGLSISFEEARTILDAEYLPPVKRGDISNLLSNRDDIEVIGIIDGVFHQSPAVAHKEILSALKKNIAVVGGSSIGALRACELYPYGMIGVGDIFNDYKTGVIESDDDVAVALNPETLEQMSESLINMRYNLDAAKKNKIITQEEEEELLSIAKQTYYPKRSFEYTIKKSQLLSKNNITTLTKYINKNKFDIKYNDAKKVIEYIKENYS